MAQILVQSPFSPAEGLLTVSRSGILYTERFRIEDGTATLNVPIEDKHIPNLHVQVDLVGSAPRTDDQGEPVEGVPPRPAYATGELSLSIPPLQRTLSLQVTPRDKELEPGGQTTLDLLLTDADGQPVPDAELAVVVVDEAILALTGYQLADPLAVFYAERPADVDSRYGRDSIVLANPEALAGAARGRRRRCCSRDRWCDAATGRADGGDAALPQREAEHGRGCSRADPRAHRFQPPGHLRPRGAHRCQRRGPGGGDAARQPHPLPGHGRGRRRRQPLWLGRGQPHRPAAAHGPALGAALSQLWRPVRAAGGASRTRPTSR